MGKFAKSISFYIVLFIIIAFIYSFLNTAGGAEVSFSTFVNLLSEGKVSEIEIEDLRVSAKLTEKVKVDESGKEYDTIIVPIQSVGVLYAQAGDMIREQTLNKTLKVNMVPQQPMPFWLSMLPTLVIVVIFIVFWYFFIQQSQGGGGRVMSFGKSRAKLVPEESKKTTFDDVAGADEEKEELKEIVEFLRAPRKFIELGARIPKGVLLVGPPGTGKTLLAKAVSGEANVPFFSISGSDFVEMFVGVGASRVRDLFEQAKKNAPCIVFIDEIDAVGRHRGAGLGGGHDEREQTLNQLLVEMNGFGTNEGIIVIAATNRPDILDPALLRPGRFDRQIVVGIPDIKGREEILAIHSRGKPLAPDVDLSVIAKSTAGFTGADLENLMNEAALLSARRGKKEVTMTEIEEAMVKVIVGPEKKTRVITEKEKRLVAFHEAGHAVVAKLLPTQDPVHQISIIPRGRAGGYTLSLPEEDKNYITKTKMLEDIVVLLGGRVAESLVLDDISTGASNDIKRATELARNMVTKYGMSEQLGPMTFGTEHDEIFIGRDFSQIKNYSEHVAAEIDVEIRNIISSCYNRCKQLLEENMHRLKAVADALLEREKLDAAEFEAVFNGAQA